MDAILFLIYAYSFIKAGIALRDYHPKRVIMLYAASNLIFILGLKILVYYITLTDNTYSDVFLYQILLYLALFIFGIGMNLYISRLRLKSHKH